MKYLKPNDAGIGKSIKLLVEYNVKKIKKAFEDSKESDDYSTYHLLVGYVDSINQSFRSSNLFRSDVSFLVEENYTFKK